MITAQEIRNHPLGLDLSEPGIITAWGTDGLSHPPASGAFDPIIHI